jgi:transposase
MTSRHEILVLTPRREQWEGAMSMRSPLVYQIPDETVRVATAAFPKGTLYMAMQAELGMIYTNPQFAALFSPTGQPAEDPARLALILVMQALEGLSDRQTADAVRSRIDWKFALALELTDPGFDASVLSEFRKRLVAGAAEQLLLDTLLDVLQERGLLKARGAQRTDSTHILAAVRMLNRLELVIETLHHALNRLAVVAPAWLRSQVPPAWVQRYGARAENSRLPKADTERQALAAQVGTDGFALLRATYRSDTPAQVRAEPAVETLRRVWIQQYYGPDDPPRWRKDGDIPSPAHLIHSPYDLDARYSLKRGAGWTGYKLQLTETCDTDTPQVITRVATTPATTPDDNHLYAAHAELARKGLLPRTHVVDCGYTDSDVLLASEQQYGVRVLGPVAPDLSWQAREGTGYDSGAFVIDWDARRATCPQGHHSRKWHLEFDAGGREMIQFRFAKKVCRACPARAQCTKAREDPRTVTVGTQAHYEVLQAARQRQTTDAFKAEYAIRAGVESTFSAGVRAQDLRRARYIGLAKTQLQHLLIAVAINLVRVVRWLADPQPPLRRIGAFATLMGTG